MGRPSPGAPGVDDPMTDDLKAALRASIARAGASAITPRFESPQDFERNVPLPPVTKLPLGKRGGKKRCEADLCAEIIDALVKSGRVLVIRDKGGKVVFPHRNVVRRTPYGYFGLGVGSPDVVGIILRCNTDPEQECVPCAMSRKGDPYTEPCSFRGLFLGIEAKLPDDPEPDEHQRLWHEQARAAGACIIVARSADEAIAGLP